MGSLGIVLTTPTLLAPHAAATRLLRNENFACALGSSVVITANVIGTAMLFALKRVLTLNQEIWLGHTEYPCQPPHRTGRPLYNYCTFSTTHVFE
jgi:hypothetical protein